MLQGISDLRLSSRDLVFAPQREENTKVKQRESLRAKFSYALEMLRFFSSASHLYANARLYWPNPWCGSQSAPQPAMFVILCSQTREMWNTGDGCSKIEGRGGLWRHVFGGNREERSLTLTGHFFVVARAGHGFPQNFPLQKRAAQGFRWKTKFSNRQQDNTWISAGSASALPGSKKPAPAAFGCHSD